MFRSEQTYFYRSLAVAKKTISSWFTRVGSLTVRRSRVLEIQRLEAREVFAVEGLPTYHVNEYNGYAQEESNLHRVPTNNRILYDTVNRFSTPIRDINTAAGPDINSQKNSFTPPDGAASNDKRLPNLATLVYEQGPLPNMSSGVGLAIVVEPIMNLPTGVPMPTGPSHPFVGETPYAIYDHLAPSAAEYSWSTAYLDVGELRPYVYQVRSFGYSDLTSFTPDIKNNSISNYSSSVNTTFGTVSYVLSNNVTVTRTLDVIGNWTYQEQLVTQFLVSDVSTTNYSPMIGTSSSGFGMGGPGSATGVMNRTLTNQGTFTYTFYAAGTATALTRFTTDNLLNETLVDSYVDTITPPATSNPRLVQTLTIAANSTRQFQSHSEANNIVSVPMSMSKSYSYIDSITDTYGGSGYSGTMNQVQQAGQSTIPRTQEWKIVESLSLSGFSYSLNGSGTALSSFGGVTKTGSQTEVTTQYEVYDGLSQGRFQLNLISNPNDQKTQDEYWIENLKYGNQSTNTKTTNFAPGVVSSTNTLSENKSGSYWKLGDRKVTMHQSTTANGLTNTTSYAFYTRDIGSTDNPSLPMISYQRNPINASSQITGSVKRDNKLEVSPTLLGSIPSFVRADWHAYLKSARNSSTTHVISGTVNGITVNSSGYNYYNENVKDQIEFTFVDTYSNGGLTISRREDGSGVGSWLNTPKGNFVGTASGSGGWTEKYTERYENQYGDNWNYWYRSELTSNYNTAGVELNKSGTVWTNTNPNNFSGSPTVRPLTAPAHSNYGTRMKHSENQYDYFYPAARDFHRYGWSNTNWAFGLLNRSKGQLDSNGNRTYTMQEDGTQGGGLVASTLPTFVSLNPNLNTPEPGRTRPTFTIPRSSTGSMAPLSDVTVTRSTLTATQGQYQYIANQWNASLLGFQSNYNDYYVSTLGAVNGRSGTLSDNGASYVAMVAHNDGFELQNSRKMRDWISDTNSVNELTYAYTTTLVTPSMSNMTGATTTGSQTVTSRVWRTGNITTYTYNPYNGQLMGSVVQDNTINGTVSSITSSNPNFKGPRSGRVRMYAWCFNVLRP